MRENEGNDGQSEFQGERDNPTKGERRAGAKGRSGRSSRGRDEKGNRMNTLIQAEISRIVICEFNPHQVIFLKEKNGLREFPIVIGLFEATTIDRKIRKIPSDRPLTHDLFPPMVQALGGKILDVVIHKVEDQTFYAHLRLRQGERMILLDMRPSDAIAIALCHRPALPLYVREDVLQAAIGG